MHEIVKCIGSGNHAGAMLQSNAGLQSGDLGPGFAKREGKPGPRQCNLDDINSTAKASGILLHRRKAQIAMEYLILTGFILVAVSIIFTFSFVNYSQNIRVEKTTEAIAKIANAVDDIYTRGTGNSRFVEIALPDSLKSVFVVHKCVEESTNSQGTSLSDCEAGCTESGYDCVQFSAIAMEVQLFGSDSIMLEQTRAKIAVDSEIIATNPEGTFNKYSGSLYSIKVSWTQDGEFVEIKKV